MTVVQHPMGWLRATAREHARPLALLIVPIGLVVWGTELESGPFLLILPAASVVVGFLLRPHHVWFVWLGAVVIQWIAMGVLGKYNDPEDETVMSLILEAFPWMALGVLIPMSLGRLARNLRDRKQHSV